MAAFYLAKARNRGKGILWLNILTFYQICGFFSAKPENIEEEFLQL